MAEAIGECSKRTRFLQAEEWKRVGCECLVQVACGVVRKNGTTKGEYGRECEGRSEGREKFDGESVPCHIEKGEARRRSDSAVERGNVETEQNCCKLVCRGELHASPCR